MANMSPRVQQQVAAIMQKWDGFLSKVEARVQEVIVEANTGLDQLIAQHAQDHGPMGAAFSAVQARFNGLGTKVSESWEKIDQEISELWDQDDLSSGDVEGIANARDAMVAKERKMLDDIDLHHYRIEMQKNADWSRRLRQIAEQEISRGIPCSHCGAPLHVQEFTQASQVTCGACHAVNDVMPGSATALFYQGLGAHSLAHEAAWNEWLAEREAKARLDAFRHPTAYDRWVYLNAAHGYYTKYYQEGLKIHPGFTKDVAAAVDAKMKHYTAWDQPIDQQAREFFGNLVEASSKGDQATLKQMATNPPHHIDLDGCIECLVERHHFPAAAFLLGIKYDKDGEDDPKQQWIAKELADMRKFLGA
jgi:uncharacterized protein YoxC